MTGEIINTAKSSFDFSAIRHGLEQAASTTLLLRAKSVMDASGLRFLLLFGTLLGAIRDGRFIEFDTDLDIGVEESRRADVIDDINRLKYQNLGLGVIRENEFLISLEHFGQYLDIYFFKRGSAGYFCGPHSLTYIEFEYPEKLLFLGESFLAPNNPAHYLESKYGTDWLTPIPDRHATT